MGRGYTGQENGNLTSQLLHSPAIGQETQEDSETMCYDNKYGPESASRCLANSLSPATAGSTGVDLATTVWLLIEYCDSFRQV